MSHLPESHPKPGTSEPSAQVEWLLELLRHGWAGAGTEPAGAPDLPGTMALAGLLRRTSDGWVPTGSLLLHRTRHAEGVPGILERLDRDREARAVVAALVLERRPLPAGNPAVFIDVGSSFIPLVQLLLDRLSDRSDVHQLSIVTASLPIAIEAMIHRNQHMVDLHLIGGPVAPRHLCTGPEDDAAIERVLPHALQRVDVAYLGAAAVDLARGCLHSDITDVHVTKRWAVDHAGRVEVVVCAGKLRAAERREPLYASIEPAPGGGFQVRSTNPESPRVPVTVFADRVDPELSGAAFRPAVVTPR